MMKSLCWKIVFIVVVQFAVLLPVQAATSSADEEAVYEMFEAQGMKEQMVSITNLMLQNMVNEAPQFKNCRFELMQFFMQTIGYDVIKKDLARIYLKHFTVSEIREITKFYKSPVGQKMRKVSTSVLIEVNNLSIQRVQSALPKFLEEMKNKGKL